MDPHPPILEEYVPGSGRLYLLFGGINAGLNMPPFEFYNSSRILDENKIFFRDLSQSWYLNGLPGVGRDIFEIGRFIDRKIGEVNPREVYFVGNSMGGYAAILLAWLVGKGTAIAFAPQTFISPMKRLRYADGRWMKQILLTYVRTAWKRHIWDIRKSAPRGGGDVRIDIFISKGDRLDSIHARQLAGVKSVTIHAFDVGGHRLVRHLRDEGKLPEILSGRYAHPR